MTLRRPLGCVFLVSSTTTTSLAFRHAIRAAEPCLVRRYARQTAVSQPQDAVKSAWTIVESRAKSDPVNPPPSTRPPPLNLPTRGDESAPIYWFRMGRAYGTFYKDGIKAVWFNYKASKLLRERIRQEHHVTQISEGVAKGVLTRSDFQLLARNSHDIGKLPIFGLLVLIFGEWLVLIVPFVPNRVPATCRIPTQIEGMRLKAEERRRISFRQGIAEPSKEQASSFGGEQGGEKAWPMAFSNGSIRRMLGSLRDDQLHHLSSTLGLHSGIWDRIQLPPPSFLLRRSLERRLQYISQDDYLLLESGGVSRLSVEEVQTACEQRGIDVLGKKNDNLRQDLSWWLSRQKDDRGSGRALMVMLFRRLAIRDWVQLNVEANSE